MDCAGFKIFTEPSSEPVTAAEMRAYLRLSDTSQDTMLDSLILSARAYLEQTTGRVFNSSVYTALYASFDDGSTSPRLSLPVTPAQSITTIYYDVSGVSTLLASTQYELLDYALFPAVVPAYGVTWPVADADSVVVKFSAGGASTSKEYKIGCAVIKAIVADMYEHPEASLETSINDNKSVERLVAGLRTR